MNKIFKKIFYTQNRYTNIFWGILFIYVGLGFVGVLADWDSSLFGKIFGFLFIVNGIRYLAKPFLDADQDE